MKQRTIQPWLHAIWALSAIAIAFLAVVYWNDRVHSLHRYTQSIVIASVFAGIFLIPWLAIVIHYNKRTPLAFDALALALINYLGYAMLLKFVGAKVQAELWFMSLFLGGLDSWLFFIFPLFAIFLGIGLILPKHRWKAWIASSVIWALWHVFGVGNIPSY